MQERIDNMIRELIELDPSLKEQEAHIRAYIELLEAGKPSIVIDERFVTNLRERLLTQRPIRSPYATMNWWALRLAPIGALALLILMLIPPTSPHTTPEMTVPSESADDSRVFNSEIAPSAPGTYDFGSDSVGTEQDSTTFLKSAPAQETPSPITLSPQQPGTRVQVDSVFTAEPSFMIVYRHFNDGQEEILGISPLIYGGTTDNVPIYLRTATTPTGAYSVALHRDNGNRVFTLEEDMLVFDSYGNPVRTPLLITLGE